ncbi:MAG: alanine racemase [Candidatus Thiodiazotropha sp.]
MEFAPQASIDHAALRHNLKLARQAAPSSRIWAVIKADGYGHGLLRVAEALHDADGFAVARLNEALALRQQGVVKPLLVLSACISRCDFDQAIEADIQVVVHHRDQLDALGAISSSDQRLTVWLKLDTGMHRLGFAPSELIEILDRLKGLAIVDEINLMSHLANGDEPQDPLTSAQCEQLLQFDPALFNARSMANSAGVLANPASHLDWNRPGIMLYGASPLLDTTAEQFGLQPVMTLSSRVIALKACRAGGRVSMDMLCVDARGLSDIQVGDEAVLWGRGLPVEEIARAAGTIAYELLCGIKQRVRFIDLNRQQLEV